MFFFFFLSLLGLLYRDACLVKVAGGLSCPVEVQRGIRQGCPISGQIYSLLAVLRAKLSGLILPVLSHHPQLVVSAYAVDISVFVRDQRNVVNLNLSLELHQKASSVKVNWGKCETLQVGHWMDRDRLRLPGDLRW